LAEAVIGGVVYEIAPFKFKQLRAAAPFLDRAQKALTGEASLEAAMEASADLLTIIAIGVGRPEVTAEALEDAASLAEVIQLRETFEAIVREAGLAVGEPGPAAQTPPAAAARKASPNRSTP